MTKERAAATESEASEAIDALPPEVETIRVTYSDLHGIQRGKDVPRRRVRARRHRRARVLLGGHGHRSSPHAGRGRRVGLPGHGRLPGPVHAPPASLGAGRRGLPRPTSVRDERARAHRPARPGPPGRGSPRRARTSTGKIGPELEFFLCTRDGDGRLAAPRRQPQHGLHGRPAGGPDRAWSSRCSNAARARPRRDRFEPRVHEQPVRDQPARVRAPRRRRQRLSLQGRDQGPRRSGRPARDVHGQAVQRPGWLRHSTSTSPSSATARTASAIQTTTTGLSPGASLLRRRSARARPGADGVPQPHVNAYRRILPDSLAPMHVNWGLDNRTTFVRIPPERGGGSRVELRVGDGAANAHLVIAACLFAGIDGIKRELDPGDAARRRRLHAARGRAGRRRCRSRSPRRSPRSKPTR